MRWGALLLPLVLLLLFVAGSCSSSTLPINCEARCTGTGSSTKIACVAQDQGRCQTPTGGLNPRCDDGSPLTILLCQKDDLVKCNNGAAPKCVPP
jgi:hypothetical protein